MKYQNEKVIGCSEFEENLSDYLDKSLSPIKNKASAEHALKCPLCHSLLNEVKGSLEICHEISAPETSLTGLEARILSKTVPETEMGCSAFEEHLTDYLDGYLSANLFHRWERHAVLCEKCTDLPGEVVRSLAACYSYKMEELALPEGLHGKILESTLGTTNVAEIKSSWVAQIKEWSRELSFPISLPQLAPVAMMLLFAFFVFSQTTSADGSIGGMYQKSFELAGKTYKKGADIVLGENAPTQTKKSSKPIEGTFVNDKK